MSQPDTGEQALEICDMLVRSGGVDLVIIDLDIQDMSPPKLIQAICEAKESLPIMVTLVLIWSLSACSSSDSPPPTVFLSGTVTDGTKLLQGVSIEVVNTEGGQLARTSSNSIGAFELTLPPGTELAVRFSAAGFTTVRSQYYSLVSHVTGLNVALQPAQTTESIIDTAFSGMVLDLSDKAWLAIDVLDEQLNSIR